MRSNDLKFILVIGFLVIASEFVESSNDTNETTVSYINETTASNHVQTTTEIITTTIATISSKILLIKKS